MKLLKGRKPSPKENKEWIECSIRQSVADWKDMLKNNKENKDSNVVVEPTKV